MWGRGVGTKGSKETREGEDEREEIEGSSLYGASHFQDTKLNFEFDIQFNPNRQEVKVQLFLGRSKFVFLAPSL